MLYEAKLFFPGYYGLKRELGRTDGFSFSWQGYTVLVYSPNSQGVHALEKIAAHDLDDAKDQVVQAQKFLMKRKRLGSSRLHYARDKEGFRLYDFSRCRKHSLFDKCIALHQLAIEHEKRKHPRAFHLAKRIQQEDGRCFYAGNSLERALFNALIMCRRGPEIIVYLERLKTIYRG